MDVNPIEVQKVLKGVEYPANKDELIAAAEENGAPEEVLDAVRQIDTDRFDDPSDVQEALG